MNDFYNEYLGASSATLDVWFNNAKVMLWDLLLLLLYVVFCWLLAKILLNVLNRFLRVTKIDKLNTLYAKIEVLKKLNIKIDFHQIISAIFKFLLVLVFVVIGADLFNFPGVTKVVNDIIAYLPRLVSAIAIILFGFYLANRIKLWLSKILDILGNNSGSAIISNVVVFGFVLFFILMGLNQAGIDTTLITDNISIILGVIFSSIALSFGLGSKDIVKEILYSYYLRKSVQIGDRIRIEDGKVEGTLVSIDNINVKISSREGYVLYPIKKFVTLKIEILSN